MYVQEYRPSDLLEGDNGEGGGGGVGLGCSGGGCPLQLQAAPCTPAGSLQNACVSASHPPPPPGNVLRQACGKLEAFWQATCSAEGSFAWQAAQSFAMALMKTMQVCGLPGAGQAEASSCRACGSGAE